MNKEETIKQVLEEIFIKYKKRPEKLGYEWSNVSLGALEKSIKTKTTKEALSLMYDKCHKEFNRTHEGDRCPDCDDGWMEWTETQSIIKCGWCEYTCRDEGIAKPKHKEKV